MYLVIKNKIDEDTKILEREFSSYSDEEYLINNDLMKIIRNKEVHVNYFKDIDEENIVLDDSDPIISIDFENDCDNLETYEMLLFQHDYIDSVVRFNVQIEPNHIALDHVKSRFKEDLKEDESYEYEIWIKQWCLLKIYSDVLKKIGIKKTAFIPIIPVKFEFFELSKSYREKGKDSLLYPFFNVRCTWKNKDINQEIVVFAYELFGWLNYTIQSLKKE